MDHGIEAAAIVVGKKTTLAGGVTAAGSGAIHGADIGTEMAMASGLDITGFCAIAVQLKAMPVMNKNYIAGLTLAGASALGGLIYASESLMSFLSVWVGEKEYTVYADNLAAACRLFAGD